MSEIRQVQILFTEYDEKHGKFTDALYYPLDGFENVTDDEIKAEKEKRKAKWKDVIDHPPPPPKLTDQQLEEQKQALLDVISGLEAQIVEIDGELNKPKGK